MVDDEFKLISVPGMLAFSKRLSHREHVLALYTNLCKFLQENGLVNIPLVNEGQQVSDKLEVRRKEFTDEGYEFFNRAERKWLLATDRGTPPTDMRILERELAKLRKEREGGPES